MSPGAIFLIGTFTSGLCLAFVVLSAVELRRLGRESEARRSGRLAATSSTNDE